MFISVTIYQTITSFYKIKLLFSNPRNFLFFISDVYVSVSTFIVQITNIYKWAYSFVLNNKLVFISSLTLIKHQRRMWAAIFMKIM